METLPNHQPIPARDVAVGMTIGMHGRRQKVTHRLAAGTNGRMMLRSEDDAMWCRPSTTLRQYFVKDWP